MTDPTATTSVRSREIRVLFVLPALLFAGLVILFAARLGAGDPSRLPSALIGRSVPALDLPPVDGLQREGVPVPGLPAAALKGNGVTVVNVWASWCAPCRVEHPVLTQLAREPSLRLVGIDYKDKDETARRFLGVLGNPFARVGSDANGRAAIEWGVYGVPETFVVGSDGTIRYKHVGPLSPEDLPGFMEQVRRASR